MELAVGPRSQALAERAWALVPGGINSARRRTTPPVCVRSASGAHLEDVDGRSFLDYHLAYSAVILGHCYPAVVEAVAEATRNSVLLGLGITESEVALAERLVDHIPSAEQVILVNSGSEATYNAIRLARAVTGREKILKFQGCYHGSHDYVLRNALTDPGASAGPEPEYGGVPQFATDSVLVCRYNDLEGAAALLEAHDGDVAAVILEPIAHNLPNILPASGFLEGLRDLCDHSGSLLIFDEIITGFRHGLGGYQALCGVTPDITTVGKAVANGFPIAAVVGPRQLMERFATHPEGDVFLGGTYNGNTPGVAAALATLEVLASEPVYEHLFDLGERMRSGLQRVVENLDLSATVTGFGSLYTLLFMEEVPENYDDLARADKDLFVRYREELLTRGVVEMPVPFVRAQVSFSHTQEDVDRTLEFAADALEAVLRNHDPA